MKNKQFVSDKKRYLLHVISLNPANGYLK